MTQALCSNALDTTKQKNAGKPNGKEIAGNAEDKSHQIVSQKRELLVCVSANEEKLNS